MPCILYGIIKHTTNRPSTTRGIPKMNCFSVSHVTELLEKIKVKAKNSVWFLNCYLYFVWHHRNIAFIYTGVLILLDDKFGLGLLFLACVADRQNRRYYTGDFVTRQAATQANDFTPPWNISFRHGLLNLLTILLLTLKEVRTFSKKLSF